MVDRAAYAELADRIERELRAIGAFDQPAPEESARAAFGVGTHSFTQWVRWELLPQLREVAAGRREAPATSMVGTQAIREFDGYAAADPLTDLLLEVDRLAESGDPPRARRPRLRGRLLVLLGVLVFGGLFLFGGFQTYRDQRDGIPTKAKITSCHAGSGKYGGAVCSGLWTVGDPVFGKGTFGFGTVDGATRDDLDKSIDVRVHGDHAIVPGMRLPIILWSLGGLFIVLGGFAVARAGGSAA